MKNNYGYWMNISWTEGVGGNLWCKKREFKITTEVREFGHSITYLVQEPPDWYEPTAAFAMLKGTLKTNYSIFPWVRYRGTFPPVNPVKSND